MMDYLSIRLRLLAYACCLHFYSVRLLISTWMLRFRIHTPKKIIIISHVFWSSLLCRFSDRSSSHNQAPYNALYWHNWCFLTNNLRMAKASLPHFMLFCFFIAHKQFTFAAEAMRLLLRNLDDCEIGSAFSKDCVHFFEATTSRLWIEKVNHGKNESIARSG